MQDKKPSMRSSLACVRGLGSAKSGTHHFIMQRLSAIALVFLFIYLAYFMLRIIAATDYASLLTMIANPVHAIMLSLFLLAGFYHGQLGLQVIIEDYIHHACVKLILLIGVKFLSVIFAVAGLFAIMRIAL